MCGPATPLLRARGRARSSRVDFGVPFLHLSVLDEPVGYDDVEWLEKNGGLAVDVDNLMPLWPLRANGMVPPSAMLAVALAGETAEQVVLSHVLDDHGSIGDFWMYVGWLPQDGRRPRSWEETKQRDRATVDRVAAWAVERRDRIECGRRAERASPPHSQGRGAVARLRCHGTSTSDRT